MKKPEVRLIDARNCELLQEILVSPSCMEERRFAALNVYESAEFVETLFHKQLK